MPEQAVVVESSEGLEPIFLSLPCQFEDAVDLQSVGGVCGTVRVTDILLQQLVLIGVFVKGLQRRKRDWTSTIVQVSSDIYVHLHTDTHTYTHFHMHSQTHFHIHSCAYMHSHRQTHKHT